MEIGLALSGGGYRATVFHLGVLQRLARSNHLESVKYLSTVSGGSLCIGLVYAANNHQWPDSAQYNERVLPTVRRWLTSTNLQQSLIWRALLHPLQLFQTRADDLSQLLQSHFGLSATLQDLADEPRWIINTACYETGALFRLEKRRMGDYRVGYVANPNLKISDAVAASAGFPVGIGPLALKSSSYSWFRFVNQNETEPIQPAFDALHLWDGGVYDNLGIEPLFAPDVGIKRGNFLIASDASGLFGSTRYGWGIRPLKRLLDISTFQVRALRSRMLVDHFVQNPGVGVYLQIDNTCQDIVSDAPHLRNNDNRCAASLPEQEVRLAAQMKTHIGKLTQEEFTRVLRHGHEVANATLWTWKDGEFGWLNHDYR